ncbi:SE1832 family protein [Metabacillus niabensis]|uniref:Ribosomal protein L29 n=1 Tax=Metabacillus niabensis TaxID=324854 RepID=A0ABT9YV95_9BACI|nr:SE1832 family protein [Metabacillus niabensis]MDQ0223915.1 ribosomal protein L29 [Metabacillus niabensis]
MDKQELNQKIEELKLEYIKIQGDIEKLESTGHSIDKLEAKLSEIEKDLTTYRTRLASL